MPRWTQQLGISVMMFALALPSWSQTERYTVPAASVGDDFPSYHQALSKAADMALANVARETEISSQINGSATDSTAQEDATLLHQFAQEGRGEALGQQRRKKEM
jgi:hypothetical protein